MSSGGGNTSNPASLASSASTIIAVGPSTPLDEDELNAAHGTTVRRPRLDLSPIGNVSASAFGSGSGASPPPRSPSQDSNDDTGSRHFAFDAADMAQYQPSMSSSVRAHVYEGGIRYHAFKDGKYAFPNDEIEQNRDDMKHTMALMLCQGAYFYSPIEEVLQAGDAEVLDLGE